MKGNLSALGDLTPLAKDLEKVFKKHYGVKPAMVVSFALPPNFKTLHWVTNIDKDTAIKVMIEAIEKMESFRPENN